MMKKIWSSILFALFGGMVFSASPAKAGFFESIVDFGVDTFNYISNLGASGLTSIPGMSSVICYFGDCDPDIFKEVVKKQTRESALEFLYDIISAPGGCVMIESIAKAEKWAGIINVDPEEMCDEISRQYNNMIGRKQIFPATLEEYLNDYKDACWFCDIFVNIYNAVNRLVTNIFNNLAQSFLNLMCVGILFLILFKVGRMLVQFQEVDIMQFLNDLFKPLGRAIIATALLGALVVAGTQTVFYLVTNPVIDVSLRIGEGVLDTTLGEVMTLHQKKTTGTRADGIVTDSLKPKWNDINNKYEEENRNPPNTALGEATREMLVQWMRSVSSSFIVGIALGGRSIHR